MALDQESKPKFSSLSLFIDIWSCKSPLPWLNLNFLMCKIELPVCLHGNYMVQRIQWGESSMKHVKAFTNAKWYYCLIVVTPLQLFLPKCHDIHWIHVIVKAITTVAFSRLQWQTYSLGLPLQICYLLSTLFHPALCPWRLTHINRLPCLQDSSCVWPKGSTGREERSEVRLFIPWYPACKDAGHPFTEGHSSYQEALFV